MSAPKGFDSVLLGDDRLSVRGADSGDADAILAISEELNFRSSGPDFRDYLESLLAASENELFVAVCDASIAGWAHVFVARRMGMPAMAEIGGIVVRKPFRRKGVGRLLLKCCEEWARLDHCLSLRVRCDTRRGAAHDFYAQTGFAPIKKQVVYEKDL
jgi:GNAT superfamily N-acetyltransferase